MAISPLASGSSCDPFATHLANGKGADEDRYQELQVIGRGSFGTATLVRRKEDNALLVVKKLFTADLLQKERDAAMNEVAVLKSMNHPNIIGYYESYESQDALCIVTEFCEEGTLAGYIQRAKDNKEYFTPEQCLDMFVQLLLALQHVHNSKVLHRDLKPQNVFVAKDNILKLGDFGISRMLSAQTAMCKTVVGTPFYLSPEVCEGKPYNGKSDVWSLGCVFFELLTLRRAFDGTSLPMVVMAIMQGKFGGFPAACNIPEDVQEIVARCLTLDPDKRESVAGLLAMPVVKAAQVRYLKRLKDKKVTKPLKIGLPRHILAANGLDSPVSAGPSTPDSDFDTLFDAATADTPMSARSRPMSPMSASSPMSPYRPGTPGLPPSWGEDGTGAFTWGAGKYAPSPDLQFIDMVGTRNKITGLSFGRCHKVAMCDNGNCWSWLYGHDFSNKKGQLGHGDNSVSRKPQILESLLSYCVRSVACGSDHTLVSTAEGYVFSWGDGGEGRLGHGNEEDKWAPTQVMALEGQDIVQVAAGDQFSAALTREGGIYTWGCGDEGRLGHGANTGDQLEPRLITCAEGSFSRHKIEAVSCGGSHMAAIGDGFVFTWGDNTFGQLGRDDGEERQHTWPTPRKVKHLAVREKQPAKAIACGQYHTAMLGREDRQDSVKPKPVSGALMDHHVGALVCQSFSSLVVAIIYGYSDSFSSYSSRLPGPKYD
eukprot:jgi/Mesvir1/27652/Mv07379-RA.3